MKKVKIGLIGLGTVGSGVVKALRKSAAEIRARKGVALELERVADKDSKRFRALDLRGRIVTDDANTLLSDPQIDIVIELIGGINPAKQFISKALRNGKHVVTANKALLAEYGKELFAEAKRCGKSIRFEASVGGGIPVIKALTDDFIANKIDAIYGIINGTSNFILTEMDERERSFEDVLNEARRLGIAERNPRLDINGMDSAHKIAILALLGFGMHVPLNKIFTEGIQNIELGDIQYARDLGYVIKLLAIAKREGSALDVRVHPTLLSARHPLANVRGAYNAIYIKGDLIGESLLYGKGAGSHSTASAVLADVVDLAESIAGYEKAPSPVMEFDSGVRTLKRLGQVRSRYYVRFMAIDKPGVLSAISGILSRYKISIANVTQRARRSGRSVPIVMMTHEAQEHDLRKALTLIGMLSIVKAEPIAIRVEMD